MPKRRIFIALPVTMESKLKQGGAVYNLIREYKLKL